MKLIIDIDKEEYDILMLWKDNPTGPSWAQQRIIAGVPLPEGYGRLMILSEDRLKENQRNFDFSCQKWINEVGLSNATVTIIEADAPKRRKGTPLEENDSGYNCENWIP